ncbi:hypothetical protein ACLKA7_006368 [Drosophila subpalustris]
MTLSKKQQQHLSSDLTCDPSLKSSLRRQNKLRILSLKNFNSTPASTLNEESRRETEMEAQRVSERRLGQECERCSNYNNNNNYSNNNNNSYNFNFNFDSSRSFGPANCSHDCVPANGAHKFKTHKDIKAATRVTICQPTTTNNQQPNNQQQQIHVVELANATKRKLTTATHNTRGGKERRQQNADCRLQKTEDRAQKTKTRSGRGCDDDLTRQQPNN